jgi:hypothetical protein
MHDAKGSDIRLTKEGEDYQLQLASSHNVVNITLGVRDVRTLCQRLVQLDAEENWKSYAHAPPEFKSFFFNGTPRAFHDNVASYWFARMAGETCGDGVGKR